MRLYKKSLTLMAGLSALALASAAQANVTVDGTLSASEGYSSVAAWTQADTGFGDYGISEIFVSYDADSVNIFVLGTPENNGNATLLWIGAGSGSGASTLPDGSDGFSPFNGTGGTILDFAADFGFRLSNGGTDTHYSGIDYRSGGNADTYLGNPGIGNAQSVAGGPYDGLQTAYNGGTGNLSTNDGTTGWELSIPYSAIGADPTADIEVFAAYANGGGDFFSANTVPEIPGQSGSHLAGDPDFSGAAGTQAASATSPILLVHTFEDDASSSFTTLLEDTAANFTADTGSFGIPDSPRSAALDSRTSQALVMNVNSLNVSTAGSVFTADSFSGNYKVIVDKYALLDSGGSTMAGNIGINHTGTRIPNVQQDDTPTTPAVAPITASTDGYFFQFSTDFGTSASYTFTDGNPAGTTPFRFRSETDLPGLSWGDGVLDTATRVADEDLFDVEIYPTSGFASDWTTVEMIYDNSYVVVKVDGIQASAYLDTDGDVWTSGFVSLGAEDRFNSISSGNDTFYDNLVVSEIVTSIDPVAGAVDSLTLNDDDTTATLTWDGFSDPDTGIVSYEVAVDGGTLASTNVGGVESLDVTAPGPGDYVVTVTGFDTSGASATTTGSLTILNNANVIDWTTLNLD